MTAPVPAIPHHLNDDVSDAALEKALRTLTAVMEKHGTKAMPIFDRLEAEYDARQRKADRFKRFL